MNYNIAHGEERRQSSPHALRAEIRKQAVARVLAGESPESVIEALGFHRSCIYDWLLKYDARPSFRPARTRINWYGNFTKAHKPEHNAADTRETLEAMGQP